MDRSTMLSLARNDDTGEPLLIVVRPSDHATFRLDTYRTRRGQLEGVETVTVGELPDEEQP
jgi:hypothetical protein